MTASKLGYYTLVLASIGVALLLAVVALPAQYVWLRPEWVCLVVLYWALFTPQHFAVSLESNEADAASESRRDEGAVDRAVR